MPSECRHGRRVNCLLTNGNRNWHPTCLWNRSECVSWNQIIMINLHCLRLSRREGPFPQTPVREHAVNNTARSTCSAAGVYCTIFKYIRRFNMIMCAGLEPDKTTMSPNAKKAQTIHNKFTKVVFLNIFRGPEQYAGCDAIRIGPPRVLSGCQRNETQRAPQRQLELQFCQGSWLLEMGKQHWLWIPATGTHSRRRLALNSREGRKVYEMKREIDNRTFPKFRSVIKQNTIAIVLSSGRYWRSKFHWGTPASQTILVRFVVNRFSCQDLQLSIDMREMVEGKDFRAGEEGDEFL